MPASIAYHTPLVAEVSWCCTGPTLAMGRHEPADEASAQGISTWHLSLSHDGGIATAVVVLERLVLVI